VKWSACRTTAPACRRSTGSSPTLGDATRTRAGVLRAIAAAADGYVCYSPPPYAPDVLPLPALANGTSLRLLQHLAKFTPRSSPHGPRCCAGAGIAAGAEDHQFHDRRPPIGCARLRAEASRRSGSIARVVAASCFMAEYGQIDLVLDPFPIPAADDVRGAVDGRAHRDPAGRDLRVAPFDEPICAMSDCPTGRTRCAGLCRAGGREAADVPALAALRPDCGRGRRPARSATRRASAATSGPRFGMLARVSCHEPFSSSDYWERRYRAGGHSVLVLRHLAAFRPESSTASWRTTRSRTCWTGLRRRQCCRCCRRRIYRGGRFAGGAGGLRHASRKHRFVAFDALDTSLRADLVLSIDVIFHLVEDSVFASYMHALFAHARGMCGVFQHLDSDWSSPHVRHRRFTDYVADCRPEWRLLAHLPNCYPLIRAGRTRRLLGFLRVRAARCRVRCAIALSRVAEVTLSCIAERKARAPGEGDRVGMLYLLPASDRPHPRRYRVSTSPAHAGRLVSATRERFCTSLACASLERCGALVALGGVALRPAFVRQHRHLPLVQQQAVGAKKRPLGHRNRVRPLRNTASSTSPSFASIRSAGTTSCTRPMRSASCASTARRSGHSAACAAAHRVHHVRRDRRRRDTHAHLGQAEQRVGRGESDIDAAHMPAPPPKHAPCTRAMVGWGTRSATASPASSPSMPRSSVPDRNAPRGPTS